MSGCMNGYRMVERKKTHALKISKIAWRKRQKMNEEIAIKVLTHSQIHSDMLKDFRHEQKIREKYVKDGNDFYYA